MAAQQHPQRVPTSEVRMAPRLLPDTAAWRQFVSEKVLAAATIPIPIPTELWPVIGP